MKLIKITLVCIITIFAISCKDAKRTTQKDGESSESPRIINIINFIRQTDYRVENADSLLFDCVKNQLALSNQYKFPTTFLFQYDALINPKYQELMKSNLSKDSELGAWWEITQPHVEAAGIKWRGQHAWVSTANIAFTPGYTKQEREKLVDTYMSKFKEIYGYYPKSVGSWFIDSHTLQYMYEKYDIVASCNCKDQVGTDGYTLWGGYWNQAYYPSKLNAYMPAQTESEQIPVPIFRMLGSDPMYQYDAGIGTPYQNVISLEPVYPKSGKGKAWVEYFLKSIVNEPSLAFNYAQAGQENSFTWNEVKEGLEMQYPLFDSLRQAGKIRMETLGNSGKWFKENFSLTPATAITTMDDIRHQENKSVWYNSRFYRANIFWEKDNFCFRDIHLFDQNFKSEYLDMPGEGNQFFYYTLPVIDRFHWSTPQDHIGLRFVKDNAELALKDPSVTETSDNILKVVSKVNDSNQKFTIEFKENQIVVEGDDSAWGLELRVPQDRLELLPFKSFSDKKIQAEFRGFKYTIQLLEGSIEKGNNSDFTLRFLPIDNKIIISGKAEQSL